LQAIGHEVYARRRMKRRARFGHGWVAALVSGLLCLAPLCEAGTSLGDWGHYLRYSPKMFFWNPDGRAFEFTVHLFRWPVEKWNATNINLRLTGPDRTVLLDGSHAVEGASRTFSVPAGGAGAYCLEMNLPLKHPVGGPDFWVESTLDRSVVWTGDPDPTPLWQPDGRMPQRHAIMGQWLLTQCSVPRRWWFWVPRGTRSFVCRTQRAMNYQSQREDWGITLYTPRGQRIRSLWGDVSDRAPGGDWTESVTVPVEPGAGGRFWAVEIRLGDSHNYSKISFSMEGVPPYLARSPEEWFNPEAGGPPEIALYDDEPFMQFARQKTADDPWPLLDHFSPCPSLGDPDGSEIRGDGSFYLWNPEGRPLRYRVGTYLPRGMGQKEEKAVVVIEDSAGKRRSEQEVVLEHLHGETGAPWPMPDSWAGTARVSVRGAERWFAFTYPAVPTVLHGEVDRAGWGRFRIECGTARNWYFFVPKGARRFEVKAVAADPGDVMWLEINAPDRTMAMIYDREGEKEVSVPEGLDGKIWHVRIDVGSASSMQNAPGQAPRYLHLRICLMFRGVPPFLAPTWEQWFDPGSPRAPWERR